MCKISIVLKEKYIMNFDHSDKTKELLGKIQQFMDDHLYDCLLYTSDAADE